MNRIVFALLFIVSACGQTNVPPPLSGAKIGAPFALTDQDGRAVTDRSYAGQYRVMYFGYTFCPDICPTDMANLARGLKAFGKADAAEAKRVTLIMISVDPARDTPAVLKSFTSAFGTGIVSLTGSAKAIEDTAKAYGIAFSIPPGQASDAYLVDHSRVAYLMDPDNKPVALVPQDGAPREIAAEIGKWVK
jgi:protein SCO1